MKIDGISGMQKGLNKPEKIKPTQEIEPEETTIATSEEAAEETGEQQELKGVLKLLAEGHFKGVADLRLRIVHADKLEGVELLELSQPSGNGKAYEKFLAIYNEMNAPAENEVAEEPAGEVTEEVTEEIVEEVTEEAVEVPVEPAEADLVIKPIVTFEQEEPVNIFEVPTLPILEEQPDPVDILV